MRKLLLILILLLIVPFVFSYSCNVECLKKGYGLGVCKYSCENNEFAIGNGDDCLRRGVAGILIGSKAEYIYDNGDAYIGEDKTDPNWVWIIKNLETEANTNIADTSDDSQHTGPILGIKNDFIASNIDEDDVKAKTLLEEYCFPGDYVCIKFNSTNVDEYGTYVILKTTVDLSAFNSGWTNKDAILIRSDDSTKGLKLQSSDYDINTVGSDATTDRVWIVFNGTGTDAGIFYRKSDGTTDVAGFVDMSSSGVDKNIADVNYYSTKNDNVQIDLRGDFGSDNDLYLVLDIIGEEGSVATDGQDDITINLMHSANDDFDGFGTTASSAEDADLVWVSTNIGSKDEDHRSLYGIIIKNPEAGCDKDTLELEIPEDQVMANILINGKSIIKDSDYIGNESYGEEAPEPILDIEVQNKEDYNIILVGGPCANSLVEEFEEFPKCSEWDLRRGEAMIKIIEKDGNGVLLVAGTTEDDTKKAVEILNNYDLEGSFVKMFKNKIFNILNDTKYLDLSDYPHPFVKYSEFKNFLIVVGERATRMDVLGAKDILINLMMETKTGEVSNVTEESEWTMTSNDEIPLGTALGSSGFFSKSMDQSDIGILQDKKVTFGGDDYEIHDEVMLYNNGPSVETGLSSSDDLYSSNIYMELLHGRMRYYYVFDSEVKLNSVSSTNTLYVKFLNDYFTITDVEPTRFSARISKEYIMETGDSVEVDGVEVILNGVGSDGSVILNVNGTEEIFPEEVNRYIANLHIKNLVGFHESANSCCCYNILNYLK